MGYVCSGRAFPRQTPTARWSQKVELVFKTGRLGAVKTYNWDIPAGGASPSA